MPLTDGTFHNDECNPSSNKKSHERAYISLSRKIIEEFKSYCRINGHYSVSGALRTVIVLWMEGKIEIKSEIDEKILIKEIFGDKIVELDEYRTEIKLKDGLLQRFDEFWLRKGFESRSHAIRMLMYQQILQWKKATIPKKEETSKSIPVNIAEGNKRLRQKLEGLKLDLKQRLREPEYAQISNLDVVWVPNPNILFEGKVEGEKIFIYSQTYEKAEKTFKHEILEYFTKTYSLKPSIDFFNIVITAMIKLFNKYNYEFQDIIFETLSERLML